MVRISNKPNVRGIKNVSGDIEYRSKLVGREGRLYAGLISTRATGFALGMAIAVVLVVIIPFIMKLFGF